MIDVFKSIHNICKSTTSSFKINTRDIRGNSQKLIKSYHQFSLRGNYSSVRVINCWNSLPEDMKATNVNIFKSCLDSWWRDLPTIYIITDALCIPRVKGSSNLLFKIQVCLQTPLVKGGLQDLSFCGFVCLSVCLFVCLFV